MKTLAALALTALLALSAAPHAVAASAQQDGYGDPGEFAEELPEQEEEATPLPERAAPQPAATSNLPFTGAEAGLIAIAGLGLVGVGASLRRAGRRPE